MRNQREQLGNPRLLRVMNERRTFSRSTLTQATPVNGAFASSKAVSPG